MTSGPFLGSERDAKPDITILARGASLTIPGKVVGRGVAFALQIILARLLGPEEYGLYAIGQTTLILLGSISLLGLQNGVVHFASQSYQDDKPTLQAVLRQSIQLATLVGLIVGALVLVLAPWLAEGVFGNRELMWVLRGCALAFPLLGGMRVAAAGTRVSRRPIFAIAAEDLGQPLIGLVLFGAAFALGWGLPGAVGALVASYAVTFILALAFAKHLFYQGPAAPGKAAVSSHQLLTFSLTTALAGMAGASLGQTDRLVIGAFGSPEAVGLYQAVTQAAVVLTLILGGMNDVFAPLIADLYHSGETERLEALYRASTKWGLYLGIPIFLVVCFAPHELVGVVFGREYASQVWPLIIISAGQLVNLGTGAVGFLLIMTGRQNTWLAASAVAMALNLILCLWLVPRYGINGAALATALSMAGLYMTGLALVRRLLNLGPYDRRTIKGLIAAAIAAVALLLWQLVPISGPLIALLSTAGISAGMFAGALAVAGLDPEDRVLLDTIRGRLQIARARA